MVTEDNVVYLMGLVTTKEADDATEIARSTSGVTKVVRVFEIHGLTKAVIRDWRLVTQNP